MTYVNHSTKKPSTGFVFQDPGLTVPGQVLDLRTIRDRYSRGQSVVSYPGEYDSPIPEGYENMTKIERIEFARETRRRLDDVQTLIQEKERLKAEKRREDDINAEAAKIIAANAKKDAEPS